MATAAIDTGAALQTSNGATIVGSAATCMRTFNKFLTGNILPADGGDVESSAWMEEQMARFSIWASNLGVFAHGHASADYRLRDSDEVSSLVIQLLNSLQKNLLCSVTSSNVQDEKETDKGNSGSDTSEGHSPALSASSFTFSSMSSNEAPVEDALPSSVLEARTEVEDAISRLNRLSASIRKSSAQFQDTKAATFVDKDDQGDNWTDFYAHLSILIIKQKFPDAREELQKHLADSLARRRNQLAYRRRHQRKLTRRHMDEPPLLGAFHQDRSRQIEATVYLPQQEKNIPVRPDVKRQVLSNTSASLFNPHRFINRPKSTTSKAPSTVMLGTPSQVATLNFPTEPKLDRSGFFECPYCFIICPAKESRGKHWRHHVMKDLAPYVCLFDDCKNPQESFQTFSDWIAHIQNQHASLQWDCLAPIHEPESFDDQDLYMEHMKCFHPGTFANSQLPALAQMSARAGSRLFTICPLCNNLPEDLAEKASGLELRENQTALQKHIAQHLQSLGLVSLGWLDDSKSDASSKRDSDLVMEDDAGSLNFDDPPGKQARSSSDLDPDWKGTFPIANDIEVDQEWESSRTSDEAALEWSFMIEPSADLYPDHTQDATLAPFVAALLRSAEAGSTFLSEMINSSNPKYPMDFLELHRVQCNRLESVITYHDILPWQKYDDDNSYHLRGNQIYTSSSPSHFNVYHDYICPCIPDKGSPFSLNIPTPKDTIQILSQELCNASKSLDDNSGKFFPFYPAEQIPSPYLVVYRNRTYFESRFKTLDSTARRVLEGFFSYINSSVGPIYEEADRHFAEGLTNFNLIPFLFSTEGILITTPHDSTDILAFRHRSTVHATSNAEESTWTVYIQEIDFNNRVFENVVNKNSEVDVQTMERSITVKLPSVEKSVRIQDLKAYPLKFASIEIVEYLQARGNKLKDLWISGDSRYVAYTKPDHLGNNSHEMTRFIIDMQTYWTTHPQSEMSSDQVGESRFSLEGENLLLLPHEIYGFSLESMSWVSLRIANIEEIDWRSDCFNYLVINKSHKDTIITMILTQNLQRDKLPLASGKEKEKEEYDAGQDDNPCFCGNDCPQGKGCWVSSGRRSGGMPPTRDSLVMLFHGPRGTGKSTTAECAAEYARQPLYKVSGQDLESNPESFEEKLAEIFELAKRWNCVVLLENVSDIFRARGNTLKPAFVRAVECFDGFLIITTTDESIDPVWKTFCHLYVSFPEFSMAQRKQVWMILIDRLNQGDMGLEEHELDELASFQLDATEIQGILKNAQEVSSFNANITFRSLLSRCTESERISMERSETTLLHNIASSSEEDGYSYTNPQNLVQYDLNHITRYSHQARDSSQTRAHHSRNGERGPPPSTRGFDRVTRRPLSDQPSTRPQVIVERNARPCANSRSHPAAVYYEREPQRYYRSEEYYDPQDSDLRDRRERLFRHHRYNDGVDRGHRSRSPYSWQLGDLQAELNARAERLKPKSDITPRRQNEELRVVNSPREKLEEKPVKGILRQPRDKFPEEPSPIREGVAPLKDAKKDGIPPDARWTKINRRLVNPAALELGKERYEVRDEFVVVLRILSKEEIQAYVRKTQEIRARRSL